MDLKIGTRILLWRVPNFTKNIELGRFHIERNFLFRLSNKIHLSAQPVNLKKTRKEPRAFSFLGQLNTNKTMGTNWMYLFDLVIKYLPSLIIAIITAIITVHLSLRRFHSEQWWVRKADSYSKIVESLHEIKTYCEDQIEYIEMHEDPSDDKESHRGS